MTSASTAPSVAGTHARTRPGGGAGSVSAPPLSAAPNSRSRTRAAQPPAVRASSSSARTEPWSSGRSWDLAAPSAVRPRPGTAKTVSTATAPPVRPTTTRPTCGTRAGRARRSAAATTRVLLTPEARHTSVQRSRKTAGSASSTSLPSSPPAGMPIARAGSTRCSGPRQPETGSRPHHTPKAISRTVPSRNSGTAASIAPPAPPPPRSVPRAPRTRVAVHSALATSAATASEAAMSVSETPSPDSTEGSTSAPETQDVPRSPRARSPAQPPSSASGPASKPRSRRTAPNASAVGSCSADLARSTLSAGSLPESQGSRPTVATTARSAPSRARPALRVGP